jgi:Domain of unknown function (DUF4404)
MDNPQLEEKLEQLRAKLEETKPVDDESRELLEHLKGDIQTVLKEPNAPHDSLRQRLGAALAKFEDSHADLTLAIMQVLDNLAEV